MLATGEEVAAFLVAVKAACKKKCRLRNRPKNLQALVDLGWKLGDVENAILGLQVEDYSRGPMPDERGLGESMWLFGPESDGEHLYVKVTVMEWGLKVVSFHRAAKPLRRPLK